MSLSGTVLLAMVMIGLCVFSYIAGRVDGGAAMICPTLYTVWHDGVLVGLHQDKRDAAREPRTLRGNLRRAGKPYVNRVRIVRYRPMDSVTHLLKGTGERLDARMRRCGLVAAAEVSR